jgi:hypothetical protein
MRWPRMQSVRYCPAHASHHTASVGLVIALGIPIGAQLSDTKAILALPAGFLMCHELSPTPVDSAAYVFEFRDGELSTGSRLLIVAYATSGSPRYLTARMIARPDSVTERAQLLAARFIPAPIGSRMGVTNRQVDTSEVATAADSAAGMPRGGKALTSEELIRARDLSVWFWEHRCAPRPKEAPSGSPPHEHRALVVPARP